MKSLEALENWYNTEGPRTKAYEYEHHYRLIKKDLELLEKYKRVMCEPIKDIMKKLEILDILKNIIVVVPNTKYTSGPKYYITLRQDVIFDYETQNIIKEWLNNDSSYL